jgi:thioesterase domain-containing protein
LWPTGIRIDDPGAKACRKPIEVKSTWLVAAPNRPSCFARRTTPPTPGFASRKDRKLLIIFVADNSEEPTLNFTRMDCRLITWRTREIEPSTGPADDATVEVHQHPAWASTGGAASIRRMYKSPPAAWQHGTSNGQITVFLMPGVHYHDLASCKLGRSNEILGLARFRYSLRAQIRFVLIRYPNWREMIAAQVDFAAIVASALRQILGECDDGPIYLAGHSFGGLVAFDVAHRLIESGRHVAFLGLLDTWNGDVASLRRARRIKDLLRGRDVYALLRFVLRILIAARAFTVLRRVASVAMRLGGLPAGVEITSVLRCYPLRSRHAKPISVPTCLFRCEDHQREGPYDYGWSALCPRLQVVAVGGDHGSMFSPRHADRLVTEFTRSLRTAAMTSTGDIGVHQVPAANAASRRTAATAHRAEIRDPAPGLRPGLGAPGNFDC